MNFEKELSLINLKRKSARTAALVILSACLSFSIFGGSLVVMSLQNGLKSYEARLGADIIVVPNQARSHGTVDDILLQGIPGSFYMDESYYEKIAAREGVEAASPQFFLASASAGCCSVAVQIIGFDPETDFSIQPWIRESYGGKVNDGDLIVGSSIEIPANHKLVFYNNSYNVVAQLDETGTGLDTAVYANMNTIREMLESSTKQGFRYYDGDPERAISSVMIRVADGYGIEDVTNDINVHVRKVEATQAKSMVSSIALGLTNVSRVITALVVAIWVLALAILMVAFAMIANERTKEFAVLRVIGASEAMLKRLLRTESVLVSGAGALCGVTLAALLVFPFSGFIKQSLDLPYLLPNAGVIAALLVGSVLLSLLSGVLTAGLSARRLTKSEMGLILREDA